MEQNFERMNDTATCGNCGEAIYRYVHSQWGGLKAYAWSHDASDSAYCDTEGTFDKATPMMGDDDDA